MRQDLQSAARRERGSAAAEPRQRGPRSNAPSQGDEARLVADARAGDLQAFECLVRHHEIRVFSYLSRWLGDAHMAEDVLQDATILAFRSLGSFSPDATFRPWFLRIAINVAKNSVRSQQRLRQREHAWADSRARGQESATAPIHRIRAIDALEAGLRALNQADRQLVLLRFGEDLSLGEISAMLDIPILVLKMRVHRARDRFRKAVARHERETNQHETEAALSGTTAPQAAPNRAKQRRGGPTTVQRRHAGRTDTPHGQKPDEQNGDFRARGKGGACNP